MTGYERLGEIIGLSRMSTKKFSEYIGTKSPQVLYDVLKGRNGISKELADKIYTKCVNFEYVWILTGEGEMLKSSEPPVAQPQKSHKIKDSNTQQSLDNTLTSLLSEIKELRMENKELNKQIGRLEGKLDGKEEVINILKDELCVLKKDFQTPNVRVAKRAAI